MQDMIRHTIAVRNGAKNSFIIGDMPYKSDESKEDSLKNAKLLLEAGADCVKVEGKPEIIRFLVNNGVKVMGHIGHLPQTMKPKVHDEDEILEEAKQIEDAGAFAVVLEMVKSDLAKKITDSIKIPTIGIGAGPYCDGQVLVLNDVLGLFDKFKPKFVKRYANLADDARKAVKEYISDVKEGKFPSDECSY